MLDKRMSIDCRSVRALKGVFGVNFTRTSIHLLCSKDPKHQLFHASMWIGITLRSWMIHTTMYPLRFARNLDFMSSWVLGMIGTQKSSLNFSPLCIMMHIESLSIGQLREKNMALIIWPFRDSRDPIHVEQQLRGYQVPQLFFNHVLAREGNASTLQPCYYGLNRFFRNIVDAKKGDGTALRHYAVNLLARTLPSGRPFCIMDYMWNELRRVMIDLDKHLPYAPYIM